MKVEEGRKRSPTDALACKGKVSIVEHIQDLGDQIIEDELGDAISCDYEMAERCQHPRYVNTNFATCQATSRPRDYVSVFQRTYRHMQTFPMSSLFRCLGVPSPSPHKSPFNQATLTNHQVPPLLSPTLPSLSDAVADGQIYLLFIPGGVNFPLDGIRYMEHEQRYAIPLPAGRVRD